MRCSFIEDKTKGFLFGILISRIYNFLPDETVVSKTRWLPAGQDYMQSSMSFFGYLEVAVFTCMMHLAPFFSYAKAVATVPNHESPIKISSLAS